MNFTGRRHAAGDMALLLAVGFVLLIACANVQPDAGQSRRAPRMRSPSAHAGARPLASRQALLSESLALALLGGGLGLMVAFQMVYLLKAISRWDSASGRDSH